MEWMESSPATSLASMVRQAEDHWKARAALLDELERNLAGVRPGEAVVRLMFMCLYGRRESWGELYERFGWDAETDELTEQRLLSDDEMAELWWHYRFYFLWTTVYGLMRSRFDDGPEVVVETFFAALRELHPRLVLSNITSCWLQVAVEATCDAAGWVATGKKLRNLPKRDRLARELRTAHGHGCGPLREQLPGAAYCARLEGGSLDPIEKFEERVVRLLETGLRHDKEVFDADPPQDEDPAPTPEDAVLADEAYTTLLEQLAPRQAEIALLRAEGFNNAEIAAHLEADPSTLRATMFQVRAKICRLKRAAGE